VPGKREPDLEASAHTPQQAEVGRARGCRWALAIGIAVFLGGGIWALDQFSPGVRQVWPAWKARGASWAQETLLWLEFFGSIILSAVALLWFTALLFTLLAALVHLLPRLAGWLAARFPSSDFLSRIEQLTLSLVRHDRVLGTALNLVASAGSLGILAWIVGRPLDVWDLGIQAAITVVMELIVLGVLFGEGRIGLLARG
jgi:hypothetical protein